MYEQNTKITMAVKDLVCLTHRFDQDESQTKFWIMFIYLIQHGCLCCIYRYIILKLLYLGILHILPTLQTLVRKFHILAGERKANPHYKLI